MTFFEAGKKTHQKVSEHAIETPQEVYDDVMASSVLDAMTSPTFALVIAIFF
jgi:hypothetical protein